MPNQLCRNLAALISQRSAEETQCNRGRHLPKPPRNPRQEEREKTILRERPPRCR